MTAAVRRTEFLDAPEPTQTDLLALMTQHAEDLTTRCATLERELKQRDTTIATLTREIARAMGADQVQHTEVVDGMLTVTLTSGVITQRRIVAVDAEGESGHRYEWTPLAPVPETRAAILVPALAAVEEDEHEGGDGSFDPTFRALAVLAVHGGRR